jgi:N-acetylglucosaminyl-diphospho-decaprenol L-rhamnosyltransferase
MSEQTACPKEPIDLSIIIVNWNTRDFLAQCLQSVYDTVSDLDFETIVVDNASADGSPEMVRREFPQVRLIENADNVGFARANNQAMAISQGRCLLLLNSDAVLHPGALQAMCRFMDQHLEAGIVGAKLLNPDGSFQASYMDFPTILGEVLLLTKLFRLLRPPCFPSHSAAESQEVSEADWVSGACLMIRREALEQVGGLDEDYFMYSEEVDWCWRVKQAGWKVFYLPEAKVLHWGGQSIGRVPLHRRTRVYGGKLLFFRKHRGRGYAVFFRLILLLSAILKMGMWCLALLVPNRRIHSWAWQNICSYRLLVREV